MTILGTATTIAALSMALLAREPFAVEPRPEISNLVPDCVIEGSLARGEQHWYRIALARGEYISAAVELRGIDALVQTRGPDGSAIGDFQDQAGGRVAEEVALVADTDGTYTLAIEAPSRRIEPGAYSVRLMARRIATDMDRSIQDSRKLRAAAARMESDGHFDSARRSLERALTLAEAARGPDDVQVAAVAAQLAGVYRKLADGGKSESLFLRAIAIMDRTLGRDEPATAHVRSQLALLYQREGERRKAEALLRESLDVIEKTLGSEHPWYVECLATLGNVLDDAGDLEGEEAIVQRALAIMDKGDDTRSVQYAALLNNLGEIYRQRQDYARADDALRRSLALGEALLGPDNYSVATALQNLGIVAREKKDYATAVAYNMRALSIRERMVGVNHPDVAHILTNLANIYRATGEYDRSLQTHFRALRIWQNAAGPYQQATLLSIGNIAKTYAALGDTPNAVAYQRQSVAILEKQLALNLAVGSERQKLLFARNVSERTARTISLHLQEAPGDANAGALAALVLLQRKGRVLDAMIDTFAAVRQRIADAGDQKLLDRLNATTAELARVALDARETIYPEARQAAIKELEGREEQLEATLAEHSAEFRAQMHPVTLEAVMEAVPDDAALLEFTIFRPFNPKAERNSEAYGAAHYAAYVVRRHAPPRGVDLGAAAAIDEAIDAMRQALRDPTRTDVPALARVVDERVMQPLRGSLAGATRLLISPDGDLNLVPFEALVDGEGRYLIERYSMSYLTSGRDLLRMQATRASHSAPVIFADPVFGEPEANTRRSSRRVPVVESTRGGTNGGDVSALYFAPLAATAEEARSIKVLFPDATLFTGRRATKAALQRVDSPRMLHVASHGFFLPDTRVNGQNPLLRSGLALAGANLSGQSRDDGILTALEATGLNLWGTKLVTLSACDTGIGEIRNGEGVYGLRRAFVLAGTETLVMSLWAVSDNISRETMVAFYAGLRAGLGRGDALRQAKLGMMRRKARAHPFYWASFIESGEWATLDGKR